MRTCFTHKLGDIVSCIKDGAWYSNRIQTWNLTSCVWVCNHPLTGETLAACHESLLTANRSLFSPFSFLIKLFRMQVATGQFASTGIVSLTYVQRVSEKVKIATRFPSYISKVVGVEHAQKRDCLLGFVV